MVVISSSQLAVKASQNFELQISFGLAQVKLSREQKKNKELWSQEEGFAKPQTLSLL